MAELQSKETDTSEIDPEIREDAAGHNVARILNLGNRVQDESQESNKVTEEVVGVYAVQENNQGNPILDENQEQEQFREEEAEIDTAQNEGQEGFIIRDEGREPVGKESADYNECRGNGQVTIFWNFGKMDIELPRFGKTIPY